MCDETAVLAGSPWRRWRGWRVLCAALVLCQGCAVRQWIPMGGPPPDAYSEADLRADLGEFADRYDARISAAADAVNRASGTREVRMRTLMWKVRSIPVVRETAYIEEPKDALVALIVVMIVLQQYLTEGDGRYILGEGQPMAVEAIDELVEALRHIAHNVVSPEIVEETFEETREYARQNPIRGTEFNIQRARKIAEDLGRRDAFDAIVGVPMAPFRALEGVSSGAAAIHEFNETAEQFANIVQALPRQLRWQTELLLFDFEERDTIKQTVAALDSVAASADRASLAIDRLPADLETALGDSEASLAEANRALVEARALMDPLRATAEQLRLASESWAVILAPDETAGDTEPGRPFDIREWESAVRQLAVTAGELRTLSGELRTLGESSALGAALDDATAVAEARAQALVDRAAWRAAQLLLAVFVLAVLYRLVATRALRPRS